MLATKFLLVLAVVLVERSISQDTRAIDMSLFDGQQFQCLNTTCLPFATVIVSDMFNCQATCLATFQCKAVRFHWLTFKCDVFGNLLYFDGTMISDANVMTMMIAAGTRTPPESEGNWVINGDAETGPCETGSGITYPTAWTSSGPINQVKYGNPAANQMLTDPGPTDRGRCHFYGYSAVVSTMWQTGYLTKSFDPLVIDNQTVWFDFSAWLGGYLDQDDYAQASLTFLNQANLNVGNSTILGPVLAADRNNVTSLLFRQATGLVPSGTRAFNVQVTMTRVSGTDNDADTDNILLRFYQ